MMQITRGLTARTVDMDEARQAFGSYEWATVHMISDMQYGPAAQVQVNWEELIELRAFSADGELHVYEDGDGLTAVMITEAPEAKESGRVLVKRRAMKNGKSLYVKEYLEPDEDGQAVTVYARPFAMA